MASSSKRLHFRSPVPGAPVGLRKKVRYNSVAIGLKSIKEQDSVSQDLNKTINPRLMRQHSSDLLASSPYAAALPSALPRSRSVSKFKAKAGGGKQNSPEKDLTGLPVSRYSRTDSLVTKSQILRGPLQLSKLKKKGSGKSPLNKSLSFKDGFKLVAHFPPQLNLSFNNSFNTSFSALPSVDSSRILNGREDGRTGELKAIEEAMLKGLREAEEKGRLDWKTEMAIYGKALQDIIGLGTALGSMLDRVKSKYEGWIQKFADEASAEASKFQAETLSLQNALLKEIEEKRALKRKFEKISRENVELSRSCETYQNKCFEYQEKLFDIANVKLDNFPPTESSWKLVLSELETYKTWKSNALKELKTARTKERKLLELLHAIKKRGFPVEEVYNSDVKKTPEPRVRSSSRESEDYEPIVSGPPLDYPRPSLVPILDMRGLDPDLTSESASSSQPSTLHDSQDGFILHKTLSNSSTHSNLTSSGNPKAESAVKTTAEKMGKTIPQLTIPKKEGAEDGFQQEFMSKYAEFSESWRKQIDAMKPH